MTPIYLPFCSLLWNGFETDLKRRRSGGEGKAKEDTDNIAIRIRAAKGANYDGFEIIPTLNKGSEALSYETFGYKFYTNAGTDEFITGPEI